MKSKMTKYEYGAVSSKYQIKAENKLTAYATIICHFDRAAHLVVIYSPEECKKDSWISLDGRVSERLDEIFGGVDSFDKYVCDHIEEIKACLKTIKQLI